MNVKIKTNIAMEIPNTHFGAIYARSGLATKESLRPANCVGVVDSDYRGNIIVALHNDSEHIKEIRQGDRVAQLIIQSCLSCNFCEVNELDGTVRGDGGFGHSGS
jgi:dUTP pyrophosphatase